MSSSPSLFPPVTSSIPFPSYSSSTTSLLSNHSTESQFQDSGTWSHILSQATLTKSILKKHILVLGKEDSGKSTLIQFLEFNASSSSSSSSSSLTEGVGKSKDLALSYSFSDLIDKDTHELQARLEFYQLSSPSPAFTSLLPWHSQEFVSNLYLCIVLDSSDPFSLHLNLIEWLKWIETCLAPSFLEPWFPLLSSQLLFKFQSISNSNLPSSAITSIPLPEGMLVNNLGIPMSIICTKSDRISSYLHEGKLTNDQLDHIQYALRKEALSYGASLHFTSLSKPVTLQTVHTLLHSFLFQQKKSEVKPNVIDVDELCIPHAWDSVPKLTLIPTSNSSSSTTTTSIAAATTTTSSSSSSSSSSNFIQAEPDSAFLAKLMNQVPSLPTQDQNAVLANFFQSILAQSKLSST